MLEFLDYPTLRIIWWLLLGVLLVGFAVMDGFDMGLAIIYRWVARNDKERRALLETIEPVWEGNQVWFVLGGGAVFAAWPILYATAFSGLYFALLLVLLGLIIRPVGFNFRNKMPHTAWRNAWDWGLLVSGLVPALVFGVAFGNLFQGVPFSFDDNLRMTYTGSFWALLNPLALVFGLVSISMLCMHGATYAALKADSALAPRARTAGRWSGAAYLVTFAIAGFWLMVGDVPGYHVIQAVGDGPSNPTLKEVAVGGNWLVNYHAYPWLWAFPLLAVLGAWSTGTLLGAKKDGWAFMTSSIVQMASIFTVGMALFPFLLPSSSVPGHSLTIWDASSSHSTLGIMLGATVIFLPIVLAYTTWVFRILKGRVNLTDVHDSHY